MKNGSLIQFVVINFHCLLRMFTKGHRVSKHRFMDDPWVHHCQCGYGLDEDFRRQFEQMRRLVP